MISVLGTVAARQMPAESTRLPRPTMTAPAIGITSMCATSWFASWINRVAVAGSRTVVSVPNQ